MIVVVVVGVVVMVEVPGQLGTGNRPPHQQYPNFA